MSALALQLLVFIAGAGDLPAAREAYEGGKYERCVALLSGAEAKEAHLYSGLCHFALGQPGDAARHFKALLDLDPAAQLPPFSPPKVVSFFKELQEQRPAPRPDFAAAAARYEQGDFAGAARQLERLRQAPLDAAAEVKVRLLEGALAVDQGHPEEADAALKAAFALQPGARFPFQASLAAEERWASLQRPLLAPPPRWPRVVVPTVAGGAMLVACAVLTGLAHQGTDALRAGDVTIRDADALARKNETIRAEQTAGFLLGGAGLVALGAAVVLGLTGRDEPPVAVLISGQGFQVVWSAKLP